MMTIQQEMFYWIICIIKIGLDVSRHTSIPQQINFKVESKLKWTKYYALSAAGADNINGNVNDDSNGNGIISTIKDTKLYVPVVTLSEN